MTTQTTVMEVKPFKKVSSSPSNIEDMRSTENRAEVQDADNSEGFDIQK
jgi:hypothetical protein